MSGQISSALIVIASIAMYQIGMKLTPEHINPVSALVTFYVTALLCTLIAAKLMPVSMPSISLAEFSWAAVLVGVAIVGIELGFLMMYRNGWNLSTGPVITMGGAVMLLLPVSFLVFGQPWSLRNLAGIVLCLGGLYLLAPRVE